MFVMVIIGAIIGLTAALVGSLIALGIQRRSFAKTLLEHGAWERAQESQQHSWEAQQEKRSLALEQKLASHIRQTQVEWQAWKIEDAARIQEVSAQYAESAARLNLEKDLSRLPYIEEAPLPPISGSRQSNQPQHQVANWQPPSFYRTDLSGRDLSKRYLGRVDLREAQLVGTSLYMADLSGACLAGANLSKADLSAANLSGADLRNATLNDTNLLVTDLHKAVLLNASLQGARHLTPQQIYSAIYDSTTQLDPDLDITLSRLPSISPAKVAPQAVPMPTTTPVPTETTNTILPTTQHPVTRHVEAAEESEHSRPIEPSEALEHASTLPLVDISLETPQPATPFEMSPLAQEEFEPLSSSSLSFDESALDMLEVNLPEETPEQKQNPKTTPRPKYNSKRRARVN